MSLPTDPRPSAGATEAALACPICGIVGPHDAYRLREMMFGLREEFDYLLCRACGTLRIATVPADLGRHYPPRYHYGTLPRDLLPDPRWKRRVLTRLLVAPRVLQRGERGARWAARKISPPKGLAEWLPVFATWGLRSFDGGVLDVGCGPIPGRLVALRAVGFTHLLGLEPFMHGDREVHGVRVRRSRIDEVRGRFDVVMFHHSLEHVPDPATDLATAARLLRRGGHLVVRTPVMGTDLWRRFGPHWWELDPPRHLFVFSRPGLEAIATRAGLELEAVVQETGYSEYIGSTQYERNIGMYEEGSWFVDRASSTISEEEVARFRELAAAANRDSEAGRALLRFRRP